jgi:hypothetical protein
MPLPRPYSVKYSSHSTSCFTCVFCDQHPVTVTTASSRGGGGAAYLIHEVVIAEVSRVAIQLYIDPGVHFPGPVPMPMSSRQRR